MNRAGEKNVLNPKSSQKKPPIEALAAGQPLIHGCVPQELLVQPLSDPSLRFLFLCDWLLSHTGSQSCFLLLHPQRGLSPEMAKAWLTHRVYQADCKSFKTSCPLVVHPRVAVELGEVALFTTLGKLTF